MSFRFPILIAGLFIAMAALVVAPVVGAPKEVEVVSQTAWILPAERAKASSEDFMRRMRRGDVAGSYELASPELKQVASLEKFRAMVQTFSKSGMRSLRLGATRTDHKLVFFDKDRGLLWNVYTVEVDGVLTSTGGDTVLRFRWLNDDGNWRLLAFRWEDGANLIAKPKAK